MSRDWEHIYSVVKNYHNKRTSKRAALCLLNVSERQFRRYVCMFLIKGKIAFKHGNKGKMPVNKTNPSIAKKVLSLWEERYSKWDLEHFRRNLVKLHGITLSWRTIKKILFVKGWISNYSRKQTKREMKKILESVHSNEAVTSDKIKRVQEDPFTLKITDQHCRLAQPKFYGEEIQMDASEYIWFGSSKSMLHVAIDRKDGVFLSGWFEKQETLEGYLNMTINMLKKYGKPLRMVTDNRGVFTNLGVPQSQRSIKHTQFGFGIHELGIELFTTSVAQKKGSVERAQRTLQRWLSVELQDRGIKTLEEANNVVNSILDELNQYLKQKVEKTLSVYSPLDISEDIYAILCYRDIRTGDNGDCIHVDNEYYQAYEGQRVIPIKGKQVLFMKTLDGRTFINAWNKTYIAVMGLRYWDRNLGRYVYPNGLENAGKWSPPDTHPFKLKSYLNYISQVKYKNIVFEQTQT